MTKPKKPSTLEGPLKRAHAAACKRLEKAIQDREIAQARLALLNAEIPSLERTISALGNQLNPGAWRTPSSLAEPKDTTAGAGFVMPSRLQKAEPVEDFAEESGEDNLPSMGAGWI